MQASFLQAKGFVNSGQPRIIEPDAVYIVDNAIKYSASVNKPEIRLEVVPGENHDYIRIADNGPGIPEEDLERVTERFVRLEKSRNEPGSGLGLSLAKAL